MRNRDRDAARFIENLVHAWMRNPRFKPLVKALREDEGEAAGWVARILGRPDKSPGEKADEARLFLFKYAMEHVRTVLKLDHFVLFKEMETVEVILEDAFGVVQGATADRVLFPRQAEVARIISRCILHKGRKRIDPKDIVAYLNLFSVAKTGEQLDQDRTMRYKTMVWLAYLLIDMVEHDAGNVCEGGVGYFKARLKVLLDKVLTGGIIDEEAGSPKRHFEGGKWDRTLYGWLQGEDRRPFAEKLRRQINLENRKEHVNRLLLAEHRDCMYRQTIALFCATTGGTSDG